MSKHLLIRADADARIGTGHVMRCLALAQAWQDAGGNVSLASHELPEGLKERLRAERVETIPFPAGTERDDAARLVELARHGAECVVVDGYQFGVTHQRALRDAGIRQLFIDDYGHASEYVADFVLNQNITAEESLYKNRANHTQLLLGTKYALLRREFRETAGWHREVASDPKNLIVTMGGADETNVSQQILEAIQILRRPELDVRVIVGPANRHRDKLGAFRRSSNFKLKIVTSSNMPELMKWADVAVTAAGSTCWELLFMELPFVAVCVAENQAAIAARLQQDGIAEIFPSPEEMKQHELASAIAGLLDDVELRRRRLEMGRRLVDGCGAVRTAEALLERSKHADCLLRK